MLYSYMLLSAFDTIACERETFSKGWGLYWRPPVYEGLWLNEYGCRYNWHGRDQLRMR